MPLLIILKTLLEFTSLLVKFIDPAKSDLPITTPSKILKYFELTIFLIF